MRNSSNDIIGRYFFDGNGKRIKKVVPSTDEVTIFVYDATGKLSAEYSTKLSHDPKVSFTTADALGSPRIKTDENGAIISRNDYLPFGEDLFTTQRTQTLGYKPDDIRQKFTGYKKDEETDLGFAQARMYATNFGRFTSVDPFEKISSINPQTLNKYIYAVNSPYRFVDRSGKWPTEIHDLIFLLSLPGLSKYEIEMMQKGSYSVDMPRTVLGYYANQHGMCKPSQGSFECAIGVIVAPVKDFEEAGKGLNTLTKYRYFGRASHTGHDLLSPAHSMQVYDDRNFLGCVLSLGTNIAACTLYAKEATEHSEQEKVISGHVLNQVVQWQRQYYGSRFGDAALQNATGIFGNAEFVFNGPIDGKSLPTVNFNHLGVVTVYSDGREEYEGPLKGMRKK